MKQPALRDYQVHSINEARLRYRKNKRVILCCPTGAGKTYMACEIVRCSLLKGKKVLLLVHREEIFQQFARTLSKVFGIFPSFIHSKHPTKPGHQFYLGMVETFRSRKAKFDFLQFDLVICDEVHWGTYEWVVQNTTCQVLGVTATPIAASGSPLNAYFDDCCVPVKISDLINIDQLVRGKTHSIKHSFDHIKKSGKDFDAKELEEEFRKPKLFYGVYEQWEKHALGTKTICYCTNVERSLETCALFRGKGWSAEHIDGKTPESERKRLFEDFTNGRFQVLCNVGVATTGYDEPSIETVIQNFATMQIAKHYQTVGRGARPFEGKGHFNIIDMGRNYIRHGLYGEDIDWMEIFNNPKKGTNSKESKKIMECEECGTLIPLLSQECPYCNHKRTKEKFEADLFEMSDTEEIKEYRIQQLPAHLRGKHFGDMTLNELTIYGNIMGYSPKWAWMQFKQPWKNQKKPKQKDKPPPVINPEGSKYDGTMIKMIAGAPYYCIPGQKPYRKLKDLQETVLPAHYKDLPNDMAPIPFDEPWKNPDVK